MLKPILASLLLSDILRRDAVMLFMDYYQEIIYS